MKWAAVVGSVVAAVQFSGLGRRANRKGGRKNPSRHLSFTEAIHSIVFDRWSALGIILRAPARDGSLEQKTNKRAYP